MKPEDLNMIPIMDKASWRAHLLKTLHHEVKRIAKESKLVGLYAKYQKLAATIDKDKILVLKVNGMEIRFMAIDLPKVPTIRVMN